MEWIEKFEYIGENLYLLFRHNHVELGHREILVINFIKDLLKSGDESIKNSLEQIVIKECKAAYYEQCKKYKHYENEKELIKDVKSIDQRYSEFMSLVNDNILEILKK